MKVLEEEITKMTQEVEIPEVVMDKVMDTLTMIKENDNMKARNKGITKKVI